MYKMNNHLVGLIYAIFKGSAAYFAYFLVNSDIVFDSHVAMSLLPTLSPLLNRGRKLVASLKGKYYCFFFFNISLRHIYY